MAICRKHHEVGRLQDLNEFSTRIAHANFSSWKIHPLTWLPWTISVEKSPTNGCPIPSIVSFFITISFFLKIKTINSKDKQRYPHIWHPHFRMLQQWVNTSDFWQMQWQILKSHRKCFIWLFVGFGSGSNPN